MKTYLYLSLLFLGTSGAFAQNKINKFSFNVGGSIQHYNGNLGNSFFQFKTTCFGGVTSNLGYYLSKSFDTNLGFNIGNYGYCQTEKDATRFVSFEYRCPGCTDQLGMGELRSLMVSGNITAKYKFANGYILKEDSKLAPYIYGGTGINHLSDNMGRNCVNVGYHWTLNGGIGLTYNITDRINLTYNLGLGCFMTKKVYYTNSLVESGGHDEDGDNGDDDIDLKIEKRKDLYLQNSLSIGFNF